MTGKTDLDGGECFSPRHSAEQLKPSMWGLQEQRFPGLSNRDHMFPSIIYIFWRGRKHQVGWDYNATSSGIVSLLILLGSKGSHFRLLGFSIEIKTNKKVLMFLECNKYARISIGSKQVTIVALRAGKSFDVIDQKRTVVVSVMNI